MFNPVEASEKIKQSFIDYISTTLSIADPHYQRLFRAALSKEDAIGKGPFLHIGGSYESGWSLCELAQEGLASKRFETLEHVSEKEKELKYRRALYSHQEQALGAAQAGANLVVTTGTGSGKTECFLLPVLQHLMEEMEAGKLTDAVRAIIIYPMNALANDQMKRLRKILATCPEITFGLYNGNTRHKPDKARADYRSLNGSEPLPNELISREAMQKRPPHILITNYSMLEYMMLRPKDDAVFSGAKLRYIVLDEAHIYRGATGMETALLMRRLRARISRPEQVQYILTSATLGGRDADNEIVAFAENLCSAPFQAKHIIRSAEIRQPMVERRSFPEDLFRELYQGQQTVGEILKKYDLDFSPDGDENEKLFALMLRSSLFERLRDVAKGAKTLVHMAEEMGISSELLLQLIAVSAKAVKDGTSLIKAQYHFFLRALEGVYITPAGRRDLYLTRKEYDDEDRPVFECAICTDCGRTALAGKLVENALLQPKQGFDGGTDFFLMKQEGEADFFSAEEEEDAAEKERIEETEYSSDENDYVLCPVCGCIERELVARDVSMCDHSSSYIRLRRAGVRKNGHAACPACEFGDFRRFYLGYEAATAVLGTALYEQLPEYESIPLPAAREAEKTTGFFSARKERKPEQRARARQFLTFSDSRADAAFFASYMEKSYQEFLRRRGLWQICESSLAEGRTSLTASEAISALALLFERNGTFAEIGKEREPQTTTCRRQATIAVMNELVSGRRTSSLVQLGKLAYTYAPKNQERADMWEYAVEIVARLMPSGEEAERDAKALLNLLLLDVVYAGALMTEDTSGLDGDDLEYLFYSPYPKKVVKLKEKGGKSNLSGWIPRRRTGKTKSFYPSTKMTRVMRALGLEDEQAWGLLEEIWSQALSFQDAAQYALSIQDFNLELYRPKQPGGGLQLYRCETCGRVTAHNCQNHCVNIKCAGQLELFYPEDAVAANHYANLYSSPNMKPFYIKEHTAQLSRERGAEYQKLFIEKRINALSSSTTFEMGVDVGSLETVFLRDVPPTPANYVQRAGRAGRSLQSAAYALTYAKLSSHDFTYYKQPEDMISGRIKAPMFRLENEKIIRRHMNAVALSAFLKEHSEVYDGDNQSEFLNGGGYETFKEFLAAEPPYLKRLLENSIPAGSYGIKDWTWTEYLVGDEGILEAAVQEFHDTVQFLEQELERLRKEGNDDGAAATVRKLRSFRADKNKDRGNHGAPRKSLIDFLVRSNVLPKYGFPVDTVELLPEALSSREASRPQMQRDLQLAVAEYAPGSEIVADGTLYTSRYIHKSPGKNTNNWEYGYYAGCPNKNCEAENFYKSSVLRNDLTCRSCGQEIPKIFWKQTLEPRRGFIAGNSMPDEPKPVNMRKPEKNYRTDDFYIGDPSRRLIDKRIFSIEGSLLQIESTANDSLVVRTQTKFRTCTACGYATGEGEVYKKDHKTPFGRRCMNEDGGREFYLTHQFKTDVVRITFEVDRAADYECMLSVLFALLEAMSKELDIERNDIKGCLYKARLRDGRLVYNLIIYDAVAGGAGHARRLVTPDGKVLSTIIRRTVSMMNGCDCEPSCYKCLRNYYNQKIHDMLNRKTAANFLRAFAGEIEAVEEEAGDESSATAPVVVICEQTALKGDYTSWAETSILFDSYDRLTERLAEREIPLADSFEVQLALGEQNIDAILMWEQEKLILCEELSEDEKNFLAAAGWIGVTVAALDVEQLCMRLGGELNG